MDRKEPASLVWVARFMGSMNRALDGDIYSWELSSRTDPLQWVLTITRQHPWKQKEVAAVRGQLKEWAGINDTVYQRSKWHRNTFTVLLLLRGLGPRQDHTPYEEHKRALHGRR